MGKGAHPVSPSETQTPLVEVDVVSLKKQKKNTTRDKKEKGPRERKKKKTRKRELEVAKLPAATPVVKHTVRELNASKYKRARACRDCAIQAGIGQDSFSDVISLANVTRLLSYFPTNSKSTSYVPTEFDQHLELYGASFSKEAKQEVQRHLTVVLKHVLENTVKITCHEHLQQCARIRASVVVNFCRPFARQMLFSSVHNTPPGLTELSFNNEGFQRDLTERQKEAMAEVADEERHISERDVEKNDESYQTTMAETATRKALKRARVPLVEYTEASML